MAKRLTVEERVANGMALLDEHKPGWEAEIDVEHLFLQSSSQCVLGWVYGDYEHGLNALSDVLEVGIMVTHDLGFYDVRGYYTALTDAWREAISTRQKYGRASEYTLVA